MGASKIDAVNYVRRVVTAHDHGGPPVYGRIKDPPGFVVIFIAGAQKLAAQAEPKILNNCLIEDFVRCDSISWLCHCLLYLIYSVSTLLTHHPGEYIAKNYRTRCVRVLSYRSFDGSTHLRFSHCFYCRLQRPGRSLGSPAYLKTRVREITTSLTAFYQCKPRVC